MKVSLNKILLILSVLLTISLNAGLYDNTYTFPQDSNQSVINPTDKYMTDDFIEIVRFKMLNFTDGMQDKAVNTIIDKIKSYNKKDKKIHIRILGHTQKVYDDINEKVIDSKTYANQIQNWFRPSYDTDQSNQDSKEFASVVEEKMLDNNISKDIITVEYRGAKDIVYSDSTDDEIDLSNRVMVTMYVSADVDTDRDKDGVFDYKDDCLKTPNGVKVDERGCSIDSDSDGVVDYKDKCEDTPIAAEVDERGCPFDSDKDGVFDYADVCPDTSLGVEVDVRGCPLKSTLKLIFQVASDKILSESSSEVTRFATFMKKHPTSYVKITGHTDSVGKATENMLLSQNRALNTKAALVAEGVNAGRITTSGRGELDPVKSNRTKEGRSANRRIEVEIFTKN